MAGQQYLSSLSSNATRLGMRLQETISEHTRELTLARGSGAAYLDAGDDKTKNIKKQLESNSDREKLDAMKRLVALISKNRNASEYFAPVVKNVGTPNIEIRKLVYIYLLKYAESEPDLALLSINTFQRDLGDPSPLIRGMALRVLSGIRVPMVGSLVVMAIGRCAKDGSAYVRKGAGLAVPRCYELDPTHLPALIEIITTLLQDRSPLSLGAVAVAFDAVCPTRLDLLHPHFRRLAKILVDVDEWGQVRLMGLLLRYARTMLMRPVEVEGEEGAEVDKDLKLLLEGVKPVFQSRNPAVVLAATRVIYYGAPPSYWPLFVNPLLRLLTISREVERVVLADLLIISRKVPHLFASYYTRFLVRSDDFTQVKKDKIQLLLNVLNLDNYSAIMREFIDYADDVDDTVVSAAITGLGRCATRIPECMPQCLTALITMIKSRYDTVVTSAVVVLKRLVQLQLSTNAPVAFVGTSQSPVDIIAHLARRIDDIKHAQARACVVWLVGQYAAASPSSTERDPSIPPEFNPSTAPEGIAPWATDVLRKLSKTFPVESVLVKLQLITLGAKLFVLDPNHTTLSLLVRYVLNLARYDVNYDVRDRGRMVGGLLAGIGAGMGIGEERTGVVLRREQVRLVLFEGKGVAGDDLGSASGSGSDYEKGLVGSLGCVTHKPGRLEDTEILPDWLERGVESVLRDSEYDARPVVLAVPTALSSAGLGSRAPNSPIVLTPTTGVSPTPTGGKGPWTDLDSFYADKEEESEEEEEEEGDEEEEEEESGDDDEEEEDEEEEEEEERSERKWTA